MVALTAAERVRNSRQRKIEQGICVRCSRKAHPGRTECDTHRQSAAQKYKTVKQTTEIAELKQQLREYANIVNEDGRWVITMHRRPKTETRIEFDTEDEALIWALHDRGANG